MAFLAKFDGKCVACGGPIHGRLTHGSDAMEISWNRRSPVKGQVKHSNPTCSEVAAGILKPVKGREAAAPEPSEGVCTVCGEPFSACTDEHTCKANQKRKAEAATAPEVEAAPAANPTVTAVLDALKAAGIAIPSSVTPAAVTKTIAPPTMKKLTSSAKWWEVLKALLAAGSRRILLVGPPGTGKSTTAQLVDGQETYRITMTEGTGIEDLLGMYQLTNDGSGAKTTFIDGPATIALRKGLRLQIDEVTHTPAEIESLLYALMDDDPQITLPTGERLKASAGYTCIATSNDNASQLVPALMDRCEAILIAAIPHPDALKSCSPAAVSVVNNYYRSIDTTPWRYNKTPSVRAVRSFERLRASGVMSDEVIAEAIFGTAAKEFLSALSTANLSAAKGGK